MSNLIKQMTAEAHEIMNNIQAAAEQGEITYQQRNELVKLVEMDVSMKLELAKNLLHDWTGNYHTDTYGG